MTRRALLGGLPGVLAARTETTRNRACLKANEVTAAFGVWAERMNATRDSPDLLPADAVVAFGVWSDRADELKKLFWSWARGGVK